MCVHTVMLTALLWPRCNGWWAVQKRDLHADGAPCSLQCFERVLGCCHRRSWPAGGNAQATPHTGETDVQFCRLRSSQARSASSTTAPSKSPASRMTARRPTLGGMAPKTSPASSASCCAWSARVRVFVLPNVASRVAITNPATWCATTALSTEVCCRPPAVDDGRVLCGAAMASRLWTLRLLGLLQGRR